MKDFKIHPAPIGGVFASDQRVRITAWGSDQDHALRELAAARIAYPKGVYPERPEALREVHENSKAWKHRGPRTAIRKGAIW